MDVTKSYSTREIVLQDIAEIEYIKIETDTSMLCEDYGLKHLSKDGIVFKNGKADILIFGRDGKALSHFNKVGGSREEYLQSLNNLCVDFDSKEIFVYNDKKNSMIVYDLSGKFKRSFEVEKYIDGRTQKDSAKSVELNNVETTVKKITSDPFDDLKNYNEKYLIAQTPLRFISKEDGSLHNVIEFPIENKKMMNYIYISSSYISIIKTNNPIIMDGKEVLVFDPSVDTLYKYSYDGVLEPFVARMPPIQTMENDREVFLKPGIETSDYYFANTFRVQDMKRVIDLLGYDKKSGEVFKPLIYNDDYNDRSIEISKMEDMTIGSVEGLSKGQIAYIFSALKLVDAYEAGVIKDGKLKEIVKTLNENDNPVVMLVTFK